MKKKIILSLVAVAALGIGVVGMSAFEAHIINVTAHIENALDVNTEGIDFGTVFPQEYITKSFNIGLSSSFLAQDRAQGVTYKLVQKEKPWTLNFGESAADVNAENRSLLCVDPDTDNLAARCVIGGSNLTITVDPNKGSEDLYGPNETAAGTDWTAPRMVIPMGGNFTIETKVTANPVQFTESDGHYQGGGILVYQDNGDVVRLELTAFSGLNSNAVYMESQEAGVKVGKGWNAVGSNTTVYLKLSRNGNTFKGEYSFDGISWSVVTPQGPSDFTNQFILDSPQVGLSAVDNLGGQQTPFFATFDFVTFNGDYQNLCPFLSKTSTDINTIPEPSYYIPAVINGSPAHCQTPATPASGILSKSDTSTIWNVDLKVPPVAGTVGQDWPASCAQYVVPQNAADYGCDIWIEVTGINPSQIQ